MAKRAPKAVLADRLPMPIPAEPDDFLGSNVATRRIPKTSEVVALEIVRDIVLEQMKPGDQMPLEAQMLKKYSVSRSSLREALRLLEAQGLIAVRRGAGKSTVAGKAFAGNLARTMTLYLHLAGATYDELLDTYLMLVPLFADAAARNPDRQRVRKVMEPFLLDAGSCATSTQLVTSAIDFHDVVARLAGNRVLYLTVNSVAWIVAQHILTSLGMEKVRSQIVEEHRGVAEAIIAGRPEMAGMLMKEHIEHTVREFRAYWPHQVGEKIKLA